MKYKALDIKKCVLPAVRVKAGLNPTQKFTTNISESLNHVIKQEVEWKENKLPVLISHLKSITEQHDEELKKAVISRGEWTFITAFKHYRLFVTGFGKTLCMGPHAQLFYKRFYCLW